jgi:uncharacterized protein YecT (DUF1311 family)
LLALPCLGKETPQRDPCPNAKTQFELNQCAGEEFRLADAEMNEIYRILLAKAAGQPGAVDKIKVAERYDPPQR